MPGDAIRRGVRPRRGLSPWVEALEDRLALSPVLFADDRRGRLFTVDVPTGNISVRGTMARPMLDIAFDPAGALYGVDARGILYRIDPGTGASTRIGSVGAGINALVFATDGTLYGAGRRLYRINPATGAGTRIGTFGRLRSAGDLAFDGAGNLYLSTTTNQLARVDPATGSATVIGPIGFRKIYGLAFGPDGVMYGMSDRTSQLIAINLQTGRGSLVSSFGGQGTSGVLGASFVEEAVTPSLSIGDSTVLEGNSGTTSAVFTVSLSSAVGRPVSVQYMTLAGTATAGVDYRPTSGTLQFGPGQTTRTITVAVVGDTTYEPDETFSVVLTGPVNATIVKARGVGTIRNDEPRPSLTINDISMNEGNTGTNPPTYFTFTVSLSEASYQTVTVDYTTADGTATVKDDDYVPTSGTLTFAPGQTTRTITVAVVGDTTYEPDETFSVVLTGPVNATIVKARGVGTIRNDDQTNLG
jgi:hypothetical protein